MAEMESFAALPIANRRDKAGLIQAFEFTFKLVWRTFQKLGPESGLEAASRREALIAATSLHLVADVEAEDWSQMLRDRNLTSHTYHVVLADQIVERLLTIYVDRFRVTLQRTRSIISR